MEFDVVVVVFSFSIIVLQMRKSKQNKASELSHSEKALFPALTRNTQQSALDWTRLWVGNKWSACSTKSHHQMSSFRAQHARENNQLCTACAWQCAPLPKRLSLSHFPFSMPAL